MTSFTQKLTFLLLITLFSFQVGATTICPSIFSLENFDWHFLVMSGEEIDNYQAQIMMKAHEVLTGIANNTKQTPTAVSTDFVDPLLNTVYEKVTDIQHTYFSSDKKLKADFINYLVETIQLDQKLILGGQPPIIDGIFLFQPRVHMSVDLTKQNNIGIMLFLKDQKVARILMNKKANSGIRYVLGSYSYDFEREQNGKGHIKGITIIFGQKKAPRDFNSSEKWTYEINAPTLKLTTGSAIEKWQRVKAAQAVNELKKVFF